MARQKKAPIRGRKPARMALTLVLSLWAGLGIALGIKSFLLAPFVIPSASMSPTLPIGSYVIVDKRLGHDEINRGDVVVFDDPGNWLEQNEDAALVKRVIAVSGDIVSWSEEEGFRINGKNITEPYAQGDNFRKKFSITVPANSLWVMGDNRSNSADSLAHYYRQETPFVPLDKVEGKAWFVYDGINNWFTINDPSPFTEIS